MRGRGGGGWRSVKVFTEFGSYGLGWHSECFGIVVGLFKCECLVVRKEIWEG
jgi:hypothetical protein